MLLTILGVLGGGAAAVPLLLSFAPSLLPSVLARMVGSPFGRKAALALLIAVGVLLVVWRIYAAGKSAEKARQQAASLQNLRKRIKIDDEVSRMSVDDRRRALAEWVRD